MPGWLLLLRGVFVPSLNYFCWGEEELVRQVGFLVAKGAVALEVMHQVAQSD